MGTSNKKIVISTHQMVYGASHALRDFLNQNKTGEVLFIGHPINQVTDNSILEIFNKGKLLKKEAIKRSCHFSLLNYLIDFFYTIKWVLMKKSKYDLFIGVDNLNCLAGLLLKKLGRIEKVIYYSIDFSPIRFKNNFLNFIYHQIEKTCAKRADETWNTSPRIAWGREKFLGLDSNLYKQKVVPIGIWFDRVKRRPFNKVKKHQLLFLGHLLEKQGVQVVIEAIPAIIKEVPEFHFLIVGGGDYEKSLRKQADRMGLGRYVTFTGWIKDRKKLDRLISESACGIAPYNPLKAGFTYYADPTKIKDYLSAGLPVVLTDVSHNAKEISRRKCGLIINNKKESIAEAVIELMKDERRLKKYRENAINYAKEFDWNKIFKKALN